MQSGVSSFKYSILNDIVEMEVRIVFDEYGEGTVDEVLIDGYDLTEEAGELNLFDKLVKYAEDHEEYFTSDEVTAAESKWESDNDR